jgi:hypothetical protein
MSPALLWDAWLIGHHFLQANKLPHRLDNSRVHISDLFP